MTERTNGYYWVSCSWLHEPQVMYWDGRGWRIWGIVAPQPNDISIMVLSERLRAPNDAVEYECPYCLTPAVRKQP